MKKRLKRTITLKSKLIIFLVLISNSIIAQIESEITQFDDVLNEYHNIRDFCISKDGNDAYFTLQSPDQSISQIAHIKKENNKWTEPKLLPFCDSFMYLEPFLSFKEDRLFFVSNRQLNDTTRVKKDFDIWYVEKDIKKGKWSKPKNLGAPVNSNLDEFYPSVSKNNNLYFTMVSPAGYGKDDIYVSTWDGNKYEKPILLNKNINSDGYEFNAFISLDEDFLLFSKYNEDDGQGSGDLYISKKNATGEWQKATNIGTPINTKYMEYCPFYDQKNEILYFTSKRLHIKSRKFTSVIDFKNYVEGSKNGLSKIYKTVLKIE
ncbi:hypothetical protein [Cellulophaga fucicola]|uniref:hypothetical protein n=1 Tax=Cellulophaga fucicola TaxID=76595 RepID=UPI003EB71D8D